MLRRVGCGKQDSADGAGILFCVPLTVLEPVEIKMGEETQQCQSVSLSQQEEEPEVRNSFHQSGGRCGWPRKERCSPGVGQETGLGTGELAAQQLPSPASGERQSGPGLLQPDSASAISSH